MISPVRLTVVGGFATLAVFGVLPVLAQEVRAIQNLGASGDLEGDWLVYSLWESFPASSTSISPTFNKVRLWDRRP